MLPSMRYPSSKLTDLLCHQDTYRRHRDSLDQIMRKSNTQFTSRSKLIKLLKNRKNQSFYHSQLERSKEIGTNNSLLYHKLSSFQSDHSGSSSSVEAIHRKIDLRNLQLQMLSQKHSDKNHLLLKNHRQSPVNKQTMIERNRQNLRLAKMIVNPVVTYHASQFQKQHQCLQRIKERMMRYQAETSRKKMHHYLSSILDKKNKERRNSQASDSQNPQIPYTKGTSHARCFRDSK